MTSYATRAQLTSLGISAAALSGISDEIQDAMLEAQSAYVDSYFRAKGFGVPLSAPGKDVALNVCKLAAYDLLRVRGFNPEDMDPSVKAGHEQAIAWLKDVAKGVVVPVDDLGDATPALDETTPLVESSDGDPVWEHSSYDDYTEYT